MKALTQDELNRLLNSITDARLRCMVLLGFRHGMRASELCGLKRADIDLLNGSITVRRLKGSITTVQPLGSDEKELLVHTLSTFPRSPYAFVMRSGRPIHRGTFWRQFKAACLAAGIPTDKSHPHVLKHSMAYAMIEANVSLPIIQASLGHKSASSTVIYAVPSQDTVSRVMLEVLEGKQKISKLFGS